MYCLKKSLNLILILTLTGCALTQPKAPVFDGLNPSKTKTEFEKTIEQPQYKIIDKVVEKEVKVYHTVAKGDYIWALGRKYDISPFTIIKQNNLSKPYTLTTGQKLYIKLEKRKEIVKTKHLVATQQFIPVQTNGAYSLTRNPNLYNKNTPDFRNQPSIPRQDLSKPNNDKNLDFGYHKVKKGENLFRIGRKYEVSVFDLMAYNDLKSPEDLQAGSEIKIPVAKQNIKTDDSADSKDADNSDDMINFDKVDKNLAKKKGFIYPVSGKVISDFGKHGHGIRNDGIDIAVKIGTPVRAAQSGTVRYAEEISTLGNMILIKHNSGYISAYTHNSKLLVKKGTKVVKGQVIALSGDSGNAKQPMLHFELRRYGKALNPAKILH
jgi:murein DD-endopeptidase MepM/ murein hydrolase activator NlpD